MADKKPAMPENWDDIEGWNLYYEAYRQTGRHLDSSQIGYGWHDAEHFLASFIRTGWKKIWFPGCGISVGPQVYAALGFQVWASDTSSTAIDILKGYQDNLFEHYFPLEPLIERYFSPEQEPPTPGTLHLTTHDFRTTFPETGFDCVLNIRSFQGLPVESMSRAAQSHFEALRPGGHAIISTINVQGPRRDTIEDSLIQAGFHLPLNKTERWYRQTLADTGIPHFFILGQPMIARQGEQRYSGTSGNKQYEKDRDLLRSYTQEYRERLEQEAKDTEHLHADNSTKIAHVVYNTG